MPASNVQIQLNRIFHPSDFSEASNLAFAHALKLAVGAQARLTILHTDGARKTDTWAEFPRVRSLLEKWELLPTGSAPQDIVGLGLDVEKVVLPYSEPARSIVRYLHRHPHDLIVLATHHHEGLKRWFHESVAEPIARDSAELSLFLPDDAAGFVNPSDGSITLRNILIPVDAVPDPQVSVYGAVALAETLECANIAATLLHIGDEKTFPKCFLPVSPAVQWKKKYAKGPVADAILNAAADSQADLLVMSTQGRNGFLDALRGSTTERVLRKSKCPVLAVPAYRAGEPVVSTIEALATGKLNVAL